MNNMPFPYIPFSYTYPQQYQNDQHQVNEMTNWNDEFTKIRKEIKNLDRRITNLEKSCQNDYTKKETDMYMM